MNTLFELSEPEKDKQTNRCRNCKFIISHEWNSSFKYCTKQKSKRTGYGLKKIKANDASCIMFEKKD